jgi:hypothetical protein
MGAPCLPFGVSEPGKATTPLPLDHDRFAVSRPGAANLAADPRYQSAGASPVGAKYGPPVLRHPAGGGGAAASSQAAASAIRANAGKHFDPVLFMIAARWFSTVRWLMPRSTAMFLLGWPARTSSIT